jgi:hypothetical protein
LLKAREVHQHRERREQLQPLGEAAEHGQRPRDVRVAVHPELLHEVVLVAHRLVVEERAELAFRHADGLEQQRIGRDVDRLHVGEGRQHHLHLVGLKTRPYFSM